MNEMLDGGKVAPGADAAIGAAPDRSLPRTARLGRSVNFREAFDSGRGRAGRYMVIWLRQGTDAARRLGVVASKRTFRRAVDRARAKRLLREAFRLNRYRFRLDRDVVLLARGAIGQARCADVEKDLLALATKVGLMAQVAESAEARQSATVNVGSRASRAGKASRA